VEEVNHLVVFGKLVGVFPLVGFAPGAGNVEVNIGVDALLFEGGDQVVEAVEGFFGEGFELVIGEDSAREFLHVHVVQADRV